MSSLASLNSYNKQAESVMDEIPHDTATHQPNVPVAGKTYHCDYSAGHEHYFQKWNEMIGFPISKPLGDKPNPMAPFQLKYHDLVHEFYWILFNKSRKLGATSTKIRSEALDVFGKYVGHDVALMGGNNESVSKEMLLRLDELFEDGFTDLDGIKWRHDDLIVKYKESAPPLMEFYNGTRVMGYAASKSGKSNSIRGADDIISIFLTEAAHTGVNDDKPLHNALAPNLAQYPTGHMVYESTPNGKRGMFYGFAQQAMKNQGPFKYFEVNYHEGLKYDILSEDFIRKQKEDPNVDFEQEFNCQFTTSLKSAFEELTEDNFLPPNQHAIDLSTIL
jgi:hypothetical protein